MKKNQTITFFWILTVLGLLVGLYGFYDRFTAGHMHTAYGSYIPWGLWVAGYIYMIGLSAGAFLLSTLVYVFRVKALARIGRLALFTAISTLAGAMILIWLDLGHPERAWRLALATNFHSIMGWMIWLYTAYFILLLAELWFASRVDLVKCAGEPGLTGKICKFLSFGSTDTSDARAEKDHDILRILGTIGVPLAVAFHGGVGALFGVVGARPYWHSGLSPIFFLVGALLSGGALLTFITAIWGADLHTPEGRQLIVMLGQIVLGLLALDVLLEWAELSIGMWNAVPSSTDSLHLILFGPYWWVFWFVHLGLGVVIPGLLLAFRGRSPVSVATAGALIAITFVAVRLNFVLPGLAQPELEGLRNAYTGPGLSFSYFPTFSEWALFIGAVAVAALIFLAGLQTLPLIQKEVK